MPVSASPAAACRASSVQTNSRKGVWSRIPFIATKSCLSSESKCDGSWTPTLPPTGGVISVPVNQRFLQLHSKLRVWRREHTRKESGAQVDEDAHSEIGCSLDLPMPAFSAPPAVEVMDRRSMELEWKMEEEVQGSECEDDREGSSAHSVASASTQASWEDDLDSVWTSDKSGRAKGRPHARCASEQEQQFKERVAARELAVKVMRVFHRVASPNSTKVVAVTTMSEAERKEIFC